MGILGESTLLKMIETQKYRTLSELNPSLDEKLVNRNKRKFFKNL